MSLTTVSSVSRYRTSRRPRGSHSMGFVDVFYPMVAGLALRVVIDAATFHSVRLGGTLIGLWEGILLLHYKRRCKSADPAYLGYAARVLVDFYFTESLFKLGVVLLWTTMGMVLADVAPAFFAETGLKRQWSRFRRDLSRVLLAPKAERESTDTTPAIPARTIIFGPTRPPKRPVPGTFPGQEWSETETRPSTVVEEDEGDEDDLYEDDDFEDDTDTDMPAVFASYPAHLSTVSIPQPEPSEPSEAGSNHTFSLTTPPRSPPAAPPPQSLLFTVMAPAPAPAPPPPPADALTTPPQSPPTALAAPPPQSLLFAALTAPEPPSPPSDGLTTPPQSPPPVALPAPPLQSPLVALASPPPVVAAAPPSPPPASSPPVAALTVAPPSPPPVEPPAAPASPPPAEPLAPPPSPPPTGKNAKKKGKNAKKK